MAQSRDFGTPFVTENDIFSEVVGMNGGTACDASNAGTTGENSAEICVAEVCNGVDNMSISGSVVGACSGMDTDAINTSATSVPSAPPLTLDSDCLSPEQSTKYYNTVTSPTATITNTNTTNTNNNNNNTLTTTTTSTTPNDTTLLISSQWAMEALKLRREAQNNVEHKLHRLREKRADNEARARGRARSSIGECCYVLLCVLFVCALSLL